MSEAKNLWLSDRCRGSDEPEMLEMFRFVQHDRCGAVKHCMSQEARAELHLHDLGFLVLEVIVDRFNEAISEFLHFILNIAQAVLG